MIKSRDNSQVKRWTKLARDGRFRRAEQRALLEGPHLLEAALAAGLRLEAVLATESGVAKISSLMQRAAKAPTLVSEGILRSIVDAETPQGVAAEIAIPTLRRDGPTVFLEGVQDAGNVGAIVRSAAAFGAGMVVLDRHCADPWSPKVLRAGAGGHFALGIRQVDDLAAALESFPGRIICTVVRDGRALRRADLSGRLGWLFGSEGGGVSPSLAALAAERVTIPMAQGTESLNVAAAAAVCLYEVFSRPAAGS